MALQKYFYRIIRRAIFALVVVFSVNSAFAACSSGQIDVNGDGTVCGIVKFTVSAYTNEFFFDLSAVGTFYVKCGNDYEGFDSEDSGYTMDFLNDGWIKITTSDSSNKQFYCTWMDEGDRTIQFGGSASSYNTGADVAAISFYAGDSDTAKTANAGKITAISGNLSTMFPYKTGTAQDGAQPRFYRTFYKATDLTDIPDTLFANYTISSTFMFYETFSGCTGLETVPAGLFNRITTGAQSSFNRVFENCTGITSFPINLFNLTGGATNMLTKVFNGCTNLDTITNGSTSTNYIPESFVSGVTSGTRVASNMFTGTALLLACPAGTYTIEKSQTNGLFADAGKPWCTPCAAGTYVSSAGQNSCVVCPTDKYAATTGASSCTSCEKGYGITGTTAADHDSASDCAANTYTITYAHGQGGVGDDVTQSVIYREPFTTKPANTFSKPHATFDKWTLGSASYSADYTVSGYNVTRNVTLTATWTCNTGYTLNDSTGNCDANCNQVTFGSNGGTLGSITKLYKKTDGGWYTDSTCSTAYTASSNVKPTKTGYTFRGFFTTQLNDTETSINDGVAYIDGTGAITSYGTSANITGSTNVYAAWARNCSNPTYCSLTTDSYGFVSYSRVGSCPTGYSASGSGYTISCTVNTYTITYKAGQGGVGADVTQTVTYGEPFSTKPANTFSKPHATFSRWTTVENSSSWSQPETSYTYDWTTNATIIALWDCNAGYTLNSSTGACDPCAAGTYSNVPGAAFCAICTGNTYASSPGATSCTNCELGYGITGVAVADHDSPADCTVTITLNKNGGSGTIAGISGTADASVTCDQMQLCRASSASGLTQSGYTFTGGWGTSSSCSGTSKTLNDPFSTYYACKTANTYTITYTAGQGGSGANQTQTVAYNSSFTTKPASTFSKPNATFAGWESVEMSSSWTAPNTEYTYDITQNITLRATWTCNTGYALNNSTGNCDANTYTVTYNSNKPSSASGNVTGSTANSTHTYGVAKNLTTNGYSLTGYIFVGWATSNDATTPTYTDGQSVTNLTDSNNGTVTLYAVWKKAEFTLTTSSTDSFQFKISAAGTFYVDCGNGGTLQGTGVSGNVITRNNTTATTYTCSWNPAGTQTIRFGGTATNYNTNHSTPAITFNLSGSSASTDTNAPKIASISGNLSSMFPYKTENAQDGAQPRFYYTFGYAGLSSIPDTVFANYTTASTYMFYCVFSGCTGFTTVPAGLFNRITTGEQSSFNRVFENCTGITSFPVDLFNISGGAQDMFKKTFNGCTNLASVTNGSTSTNYIPENFLSGITSGTDVVSNMFAGTSLSSCPAGTYIIPKSQTGGILKSAGRSWCSQCSAGTYTRTTGQTSCTACATGSYNTGTGNTSCTACDGGKTNTGTGNTSCSADCSSIANLATWATPSWSANTVTNLCTVATCDACESGKGLDSCSYNTTGNTCNYTGVCKTGYNTPTATGKSVACMPNQINIVWDGVTSQEELAANVRRVTYGGDIHTPSDSNLVQQSGAKFAGWKFKQS